MNLTDQQKITARRITGLFVAALALFTLLSSASYLFTWKADMSLQGGESVMEAGVKANNLTAKLGYKLGKLLVCDWFGIGSFALLVILVVVADWLLRGKSRYSVLKTVAVVLSGTFIASLLLAWISKLFGLTNCLGGGLGGRFGAYVVDWSDNLVGYFTPVLIFLLIVCWLVFSSRRFSEWVSSLTFGREKEEDHTEEEPESEPDVETVTEPAPEPAPEPVSEPVPMPVAVSAAAPVTAPQP